MNTFHFKIRVESTEYPEYFSIIEVDAVDKDWAEREARAKFCGIFGCLYKNCKVGYVWYNINDYERFLNTKNKYQ